MAKVGEKQESRRKASARFFGWLLLGAGLAVLFTLLCRPPALLSSLESRALDTRFRWREPLPFADDVVIVAIDEKSLRDPDLGRWEWDRLWHARLLDELAKHKPLAIGFDVIFAEPQRHRPEDDAALAAAVGRAGCVLLAAHVADPGAPLSPEQRALAERLAVEPQIVVNQGLAPLVAAVVPPRPEFAAAAAGVGVLAAKADPDGTVRRALLLIAAGGLNRFYPTLPLALAARAQRWDYGEMQFNLGREAALSPTSRVPLAAGAAQINFLGPPGTIPQVSFGEVVRGKARAGAFAGKIVLIGLTAPGLGDIYPTPLGQMYGVEIQAHIVENLLHNSFLESASLGTALTLALLLGVLAAAAAAWLRPVVGLAAVVLVVVIYHALGMFQFRSAGMIWPALGPTLAALFTFGVIAVFRLSTEEAGRRRLREEFGRYAPPQVVARLDTGEMRERSAGTIRPVTALFADVRGFTVWSAGARPHEVVSVLNTYFEAMTQLAFDLEGTVDNIVGDEIFITFNALQDQPDHAPRAAHLALNMLQALDGLNRRWLAEGVLQEPLRIGVGINSGEALVGNLGSRVRTQYTCLGQTINLASRLQSLNKELGTSILTTAETAEQLQGLFALRDWGEQEIRGHPVPVHVVEILGRWQDYPAGEPLSAYSESVLGGGEK